MKVLFLSSWYPPHVIGGAERVVQTLAAGLLAGGHEPVVLTTEFQGDQPERVVDDVRVRCLPIRNVYDFSTATRPEGLKPIFHALDSHNPLMGSSIERVIRDEKPDLVHTHVITGFSPSAWSAAARCRVPVIHTLHDHYLLCARSSMARDGVWCRQQHLECVLFSIPRRQAARHVDLVVGVSEYILERHREAGSFRDTRSAVINNPCHLVGGIPSRPKDSAHRPLRLGFMARLEPNKGIVELLDAVRSLPSANWSLRVAGRGEPRFADEIRSKYESDRISFVGYVEPTEFLPRIDLLIAPSNVPESFGMSVAESLALGVPVVVSTRGALPELINQGQNGFLFDPDDASALPRILARLIADRAWFENVAAACIASVERLAPDKVVAQYTDLYASMLKVGGLVG